MTTTTTTITQKHSQTTRPDLRSRMSSRRRLPHPNASTSTTPTARESVLQQQHVMLSYSEFLRNFDTIPVSFNGDYRHRPSFAISPFDEVSDGIEPGPSQVHSGFYPQDQQQDFLVESGWMRDEFGNDHYVGHGKIEEVEVEGVGATVHSDDEVEEDFATPRAKITSSLFPSSSVVGGRGDDAGTERGSKRSRKDSLPLTSTPPSGQRLRNLPSHKSLKETTTGSDYQSLKATSTATPHMYPPTNLNNTIQHSTLAHDKEVELVGEILDSIVSSQEDIQFMSTYFLAKSRGLEKELSQHIDLCSRMEESLASLRASMNLRMQMGAEEWDVRSASWYQKTLERLSRMRGTVEAHALRPRPRAAILAKLEQHEAKLADLASKYSVAFDRLRLRHLHFLLTQSHEEAKLHKDMKKSRLLSRASFERRWKEGKTLRETLRVNFSDLQQEFYNNAERHLRHPSAP
ncbi:hypothetical protein CPB83DRAFT_834880 [Crepidotus variabilis]|uniref:Uncharacterized protein n=1 Tax=Crepidotus variabilis TaxID=179855 RepID=A0A9P6EIY7_9AGAR|nr:hypothetical protein CPB83DRAFT_834880 [Crepidotus variabilis]